MKIKNNDFWFSSSIVISIYLVFDFPELFLFPVSPYLGFDGARLVVLEVQLQLGLAVVAGAPQLGELVLPDDAGVGPLGQREALLPVQREAAGFAVVRHGERFALAERE